ncbi:MAG: DEAD/DEAH box helicase, partial [Lentisphaeria bacterium]
MVGLASKKRQGDWQVPQPENREEENCYFQDFALDPRLLKAILLDLQFSKCTPIQQMALPVALADKDLAGKAQTGTGKTAVFLISIIQAYLNSKQQRRPNQPFALVLAPTRELAIQIAKDAELLSIYTPLRVVAVYGGMDYDRQRRLLSAGCDLVVATPGRLIDYLNQSIVDFSLLKFLIIDEADRMLDMGFIPDVK